MCHHLIGTKTDFFLDCSIMEAKTPSFSWHAWKSIMKGRDVIREGGLWRIGDGRAISFWNSLNYGKKSPLWNHSRLKQCDNFIDLLGRILIENRDPTLFSMVIRAVWNRRNNIRLDKQTITLRQLLQQAKDWFQEFSALLANPAPQWIPPATSWRPPNASWYKINSNGTAKENCAGIRAVIRNEQGLVMASLSQEVPLPFTVVKVEALAGRRAVEFAAELDLDRIILEGDSLILTNTLWSGCRSLAQFGHIAIDVQHIVSQSFIDFNFSHVSRLCNTEAHSHSLARRAICSSHMVFWMDDVPFDVIPVLHVDINSLLY